MKNILRDIPPQASIIIPLCNRVDMTKRCWNSILENTEHYPYEVVFVNNASTDGTTEFINSIVSSEHPYVTVVSNRMNEGFARGCNQGAQAAQGDVLVFLNNDTIVHENWLTPLFDELSEFPETGVVGSRLVYSNGTIQHAGVCIDRKHIPYHIFLGADFNDPRVSERRSFRIVTGACMAVRKREFLDLGGFDEGYINGHEDVDLCLRYGEFGKQIVYRPDSVVTHFESQSDGRMDHCQFNTNRTLVRWHNKLQQDDFNYDFRESSRRISPSPFTLAIKIPSVDKRAAPSPSTLRMERLAKELCRIGHQVQIHANPDWGLADLNIDITLVVPGDVQYLPKPYTRNVLWLDKESTLKTLKNTYSHYSLAFSTSAFFETELGMIPTITLPSMGKKISSEDLATLEAALLGLVKKKPISEPTFRSEGKVSILMATYNRRDMLPTAIKSVIKQNYSDWELIIINDGGEDVSGIVKQFNDKRILYYNNEHGSKGKAINKAFSLSSGEYIAYLDDDDLWFHEHLERSLFILGNLPGVKMTYSDTLITTQEPDGYGWKTVSSLPVQCPQVSFVDLLETNCIPGISVVHSRALFEQVGGMDEKLSVLIDFDMWRRLAMHTVPYHVSELTAEHFIRPSKTTNGAGQITNLNLASKRHYLANACRILRKKLPDDMPYELQLAQTEIRKKVQAIFLQAQGDFYSEIGELRRATKSYKLAGTLALNLCRQLIDQKAHKNEGSV